MGIHQAILQRLDVSHINDDVKTFYNVDSFKNTESWQGVPIFYDRKSEIKDSNVRHLTKDEVENKTYPIDEYDLIGTIQSAKLSTDGEPALISDIEITVPKYDKMIDNHEISLSTGFMAHFDNVSAVSRDISGDVAPYHVLAFRRNGCLNCQPNDKGAMILNCEAPKSGDIMAEEVATEPKAEGMFKQILAKLEGLGKPSATIPEEEKIIMTETSPTIDAAQIGNVIAERDALKAQVDALVAEKETARKDAEWKVLYNTLPAAWKEKEPEMRAEFESSPASFAVKLVTFTNTVPQVKAAVGNTACACEKDSVAEMEKIISAAEKSTGYKIY